MNLILKIRIYTHKRGRKELCGEEKLYRAGLGRAARAFKGRELERKKIRVLFVIKFTHIHDQICIIFMKFIIERISEVKTHFFQMQ